MSLTQKSIMKPIRKIDAKFGESTTRHCREKCFSIAQMLCGSSAADYYKNKEPHLNCFHIFLLFLNQQIAPEYLNDVSICEHCLPRPEEIEQVISVFRFS